MKIFGAEYKGVRDVLSVATGVLTGGLGLIGTLAKKHLISDDDKWIGKKGLIGIAIAFTGIGVLPYLLANPGQPGRDVRDARQSVVDGRY
jgi:hypothetical protein